ncbi:MAG: hypothetical protein ACXWH7_15375, partial [Thermoanaerobaculia bacterium]
MIERLLDRVAELVLHRPRAVLGVALAIVLASGVVATRLRIDPDVLNLIPRGNREVNEFREILRDTGTLDFHVIVVNLPKGGDPESYYPLLDAIGERLAKSKRIDGVTWRLPDALAMIDRVLPYSMLLLSPRQLDDVARKLTDEGIRESVARNHALLQTPQSTMAKELVRVDPFNLLPIFMEKLRRAGGGLSLDFADGYYVSADRSAAMIIARPHRAAQDLPFSRAL